MSWAIKGGATEAEELSPSNAQNRAQVKPPVPQRATHATHATPPRKGFLSVLPPGLTGLCVCCLSSGKDRIMNKTSSKHSTIIIFLVI